METIRVIKAGIEDFKILSEVGRQAFDEAFGSFNDPVEMQKYLDVAFNTETIKTQLSDPEVTFMIALIEGKAVGYFKVRRNATFPVLESKRVIQLERIYRLKEFTKKRVGDALMTEVVKIAKAENFEVVWLSVWQENKLAIDFYRKWKFDVIGVKQFKIGDTLNDDYVMALRIT